MVDRAAFIKLAQNAALKISQYDNFLDIPWREDELIRFDGGLYIPYRYCLGFSRNKGDNARPVHQYELHELKRPGIVVVPGDKMELCNKK